MERKSVSADGAEQQHLSLSEEKSFQVLETFEGLNENLLDLSLSRPFGRPGRQSDCV